MSGFGVEDVLMLGNVNQRAVREKNRAAFTMIELLIALMVVSILVALAVPMVSDMTQRTATVKCAANLRGLGLIIFQYANENNGALLPTLKRTDAPPGTSGLTWMDILNQSGILPASTWSQRKESVMCCPARTTHNPRHPNSLPSANFNGLHYGMSSFPGVDNLISYGNSPNQLVSIQNPSQTLLMTEAEWWYLIYPTSTNNRISPHRGGCNSLFVDGHVEFYPGPLPVWKEKDLRPN